MSHTNEGYVFVSRATGRGVFETFSAKVAAAVNHKRYVVLRAGAYLGLYNRAVSAAGGVGPTGRIWDAPDSTAE